MVPDRVVTIRILNTAVPTDQQKILKKGLDDTPMWGYGSREWVHDGRNMVVRDELRDLQSVDQRTRPAAQKEETVLTTQSHTVSSFCLGSNLLLTIDRQPKREQATMDG
jgi:hypothetical protein